ncbi:MAG: hypothetical protein NTZ38_01370, partial [Candidatus Taylorbacteria bacterium]|nr:hypothetical protein [Candidatus Taylorbacteria bacterium]
TIDGNSKEAIAKAKYMLDKVKIYALPSTRNIWRSEILQAIQKAGFEPSSLEHEKITILGSDTKNEASSRLLKLRDGSCLRIDEAMNQVNSVENLKDLISKEQTESYFNWSPVIEHLVDDLDKNDTYELANLFKHKWYSAQILSIISKRFLTLCDFDYAWSIGLESLEASKSWGWDRQYDGGSRLSAFEALIQTMNLLSWGYGKR